MKHPKYLLAISVIAAMIMTSGCSHPNESVTPAAPPVSPQQQIQQLQNDPSQSPETKAIRLKAAQDRLGPDASHYPHAHSAAPTSAP